MSSTPRILAINPGGMTTRVAVYEGEERVFDAVIEHPREEIDALCPPGAPLEYASQLDYRKDAVERALEEGRQAGEPFDAVVGRGGLLRPIRSGTYDINEQLLEDARSGYQGQHASNLGALLADGIARDLGGRAFIVDPVSVDEFEPLARYSGHRDIERKSLGHALNTRATARKVARLLKRPLSELSLIVAHLGSGISITPITGGRMVDVNNAASGGPFSPERSGGLPLIEMLDYMKRENVSIERMQRIILRESGLTSYLGTNDFRSVAERALEGDAAAGEIVEAMAYQIAKEIAAMASVLKGHVDAVAYTGSMAYSGYLVGLVDERVSFIADKIVLPGENELESLAVGALEVLEGREGVREYPGGGGPKPTE
jgi:butyrate kinase